ncbi:uncharacterized protein MAM_00213 [Metarhizium album ARSEF 1941]|uniref:Uncharacterized protein n=1 Tax=Metarhizium album (strain ARSEF 1941) TaxID=1081103 RepID=A0A0B2WY62_METAS|nr:uncharacterized protein MAM_00213 [Metarhizium album ARSEF 1941]KHO01212.1 hypothetical protein MAM_00213 [Metarhizium album ARSEF 1941]
MEVVDMLPAEEQRSVWDETERNFWLRFDDENDASHGETQQMYRIRASKTRAELDALMMKQSQLTERQERLLKELTQVEAELARVVEACDDKATKLNILEQEYRQSEHERLEQRAQIAKSMERFFRIKRGEDPDALSERDRDHLREVLRNSMRSRRVGHEGHEAARAEALEQANEAARTTRVLTPVRVSSAAQRSSNNVLVNIVDADGHVIGPVERTDPWNQWVEFIQGLPIKRHVKIRRGRKFTSDHLGTIYDRSEAKGVRWLACMIQATGEIQQRRCHSCDKNQGAFDDCIVLGGPLFQKCGNCEWNRQGCHMPSTPKSANREFGNEQMQPRDAGKESEQLVYRMPPASQSHPHPSREPRTSGRLNGNPIVPEPTQMPTPKESRDRPFSNPNHVASNGFTPANFRSRPPSRDIPTPSVQSVENSPQPAKQRLSSSDEITRSNLILRHDGTVYTFPECVQGVPLVKIDENHPYWDPRWPPVRSIIEPQLELWREKFVESVEKKAKGEGGSARFQNGRQVNRGIKILEFLRDGEISPYQLLSKQYTHTGKGTITAYDTLFRMCETLGELAKYQLDISPVEWLRHRLHEIIAEKGPNFNYSKIMHDFYHDPKLATLRSKNGYKSIGRPSGYKAGQTAGNGNNSTPQGGMRKRKSMHSQTDTPRATPPSSHSPSLAQEDYNRSPLASNAAPYSTDGPFEGSMQKRLKPLSPVSTHPNDEFYTDGISDTDSWSGASIQTLDWRIYQVKTRLFTSSTKVTQYWHWKEEKRIFEHQVLKDTNPASWGILRSPIDFNIALDDIVQVDWNIDALQVHFVIRQFGSRLAKQDKKPIGDVMAAFKRETTMRRFLSYCRQRRLKLVKVTADEIEQRWGNMQSEKLPNTDEEASPAFRE